MAFGFGFVKRANQQGSEDGDNGDDDEKFGERECTGGNAKASIFRSEALDHSQLREAHRNYKNTKKLPVLSTTYAQTKIAGKGPVTSR